MNLGPFYLDLTNYGRIEGLNPEAAAGLSTRYVSVALVIRWPVPNPPVRRGRG